MGDEQSRLQRDGRMSCTTVCNPRKIGFALTGNIWLDVDIKRMEQVIEELWYISLTTGRIDIDLVFNVHSVKELEKLLYEKINRIEGVRKTETPIIVSYRKRLYHWGTGLADQPKHPA